MNSIRLQFSNREHGDLVLSPGVRGVGRDESGRLVLVDDPARSLVQFSVDRRGLWMQVRDDVRGVHINGRPVRHMAMLRLGDAIHVDGHRLTLCGPQPPAAPAGDEAEAPRSGASMVLRGVGGPHHGRALPLDKPRLVGGLRSCDLHIDEPAFAERHARLEPHPEGAVLRDLGSEQGSWVNGWPVRHALLLPGAQLIFGSQHRFVLEAPTTPPLAALSEPFGEPDLNPVDRRAATAPPRRPARRVPWLLLAALLLSGALSLLLLYGVR
ncbi:FHA domain-containing protein [Marilutibacter spongiae]|uniref:FHA domain-containing protein n=1 Tax=Marilutibacter spongiae TaxID=2025720 RepID=A0A7W3Y4Y0_9GAMM|nr:FHA domain-containing protein [Lysobacter spongiae]